MKKMFVQLVSLCLAVLMLAGCGAKTADNPGTAAQTDSEMPHFKIGVLEVQVNDESTNRAKWFNDYIGPAYNCEFMFSEACSDLNAAMNFIENAADAGCNAIINYYAVGANSEQLAQLCADYDMVLVENGGMNEANQNAFSGNYPNYLGGFMADQPATGKLFYDYLKETLDTSISHGFIVGTGGAYQGNAQQTEISDNMLKAIAELYDLTFDQSIESLYQSEAPLMATNDKGIDVYCYPGHPSASGWLEGLTAALQTGKYDYLLLSPNALANVGTAVDETEKAMQKDITVIGFGTFGDALTAAMHGKDSFGNQSVAMSTVKFTSIVSTMGFCKVYNALTGNLDACMDENGKPSVLLFRMQSVTSPEQLDEMSGWDTNDNWIADLDFVDSVIASKNPGLTNAEIQDAIYGMTYDVIKARLG